MNWPAPLAGATGTWVTVAVVVGVSVLVVTGRVVTVSPESVLVRSVSADCVIPLGCIVMLSIPLDAMQSATRAKEGA